MFLSGCLTDIKTIRIQSRFEEIFSIGNNFMLLATWLGEDRKCSAAVAGLELVLGLLRSSEGRTHPNFVLVSCVPRLSLLCLHLSLGERP